MPEVLFEELGLLIYLSVCLERDLTVSDTHNVVWDLTPSLGSRGRDNALDPPASHPD